MTWEELIGRLEADLRTRQDLDTGRFHDEEAWEIVAELLTRRGRLLLRTQFNLESVVADDVIQDVLLKLQSLDTMQRIRKARSPEGYLIVMLRNTARDWLRRRTIERDLLSESTEDDFAAAEEKEVQAPSDGSRRLRKVLKFLTDDDRELLHMKFWRNMSIQEIAESLQISYSAAAVRSFRALKRVEALMEKI